MSILTVFEKAMVAAVRIVGIPFEVRLTLNGSAFRVFPANMAAGVTAAFA